MGKTAVDSASNGDESIIGWLRLNFGIVVSDEVARELRRLAHVEDIEAVTVLGRDVVTGLPKPISVPCHLVSEV